MNRNRFVMIFLRPKPGRSFRRGHPRFFAFPFSGPALASAFCLAWFSAPVAIHAQAEKLIDRYKSRNATYLSKEFSRKGFVYPEFEKFLVALENPDPEKRLAILNGIRAKHPAFKEILAVFQGEAALRNGDYRQFVALERSLSKERLKEHALNDLVKHAVSSPQMKRADFERMEKDFPALKKNNAFLNRKLEFYAGNRRKRLQIAKQMWLNGQYSKYLVKKRHAATLKAIEQSATLEEWEAYLRRQFALKDYRNTVAAGKKAIRIFLDRKRRPAQVYLVTLRAMEKLRQHLSILKILENPENASIFQTRGHALRKIKTGAYLGTKRYSRAEKYVRQLQKNRVPSKTINALNLMIGERYFYYEQNFEKAKAFFAKIDATRLSPVQTEKYYWEKYLMGVFLKDEKALNEIFKWFENRDFVSDFYGSGFCYWSLKNRRIHNIPLPEVNPCYHKYPNSYYSLKSLRFVGNHENIGLKNLQVGFRIAELKADEIELLEFLGFLLNVKKESLAKKMFYELITPASRLPFIIAAVELMEKFRLYFTVQRILLENFRETWLDVESQRKIAFRYYYPKAFERDVETIAKLYGVEKNIVFSIMREESHFNPRIASPAGAVGLMQLMPGTAREIAGRRKIKYRRSAILNGRTNLDFGTYYFDSLLDSFKGNLELSLASYNGGPGNVRKWIKRYGTEDMDVFVELIPFRETRGYVKKVMRSYYLYELIY